MPFTPSFSARPVAGIWLALALGGCVSDRGRGPLDRAAAPGPSSSLGAVAAERDAGAALGAPTSGATLSPASSSDVASYPTAAIPAPAAGPAGSARSETTPVDALERALEQAGKSGDPRDEFKRLAIEHIRRDELALARALLDELIAAPALARAESLLRTQRPDEALTALDAVLRDVPGEPRAVLLYAEASLRSGLLSGNSARLEQAFDAYLRAGWSADGRLGASRAARALGDHAQAAKLAREGWAALGPDPALARGAWDEPPERTLSEALWLWFDSLARPPVPALDESYALAAEEVKSASLRMVARQPDDTTVWLRIAHVERLLGRADDEVRTLERALAANPGSERLAERLADAALARGGWGDVTSTLEQARARHPVNAALWRSSASARLESALARPGVDEVGLLRKADTEFERWGALAPGAREAALRQRALCRSAAGWFELEAGRVENAVSEFRAVNSLAPGALHWSVDERVAPALRGLAECATRFSRRGSPVPAAQVWSDLRKQSPEVVEWAMLAGRAWREAAEQALLLAKELKLAADGRVSDPAALEELRRRAGVSAKPSQGLSWTLALQSAATDANQRAGRWFKASYQAFVDAAQLAPNDLRLLCDASEVAVYQLKRDLPNVREFLREAIRVGELRSNDPALTGDDRRAVLEALGDAHECMGVLLLEHRREPAKAKIHFLRSLEIGPDPRPIVRETYLPQCEEAIRRTLR